MLVADVDDTLTGDDTALGELMAALRTAGNVRLALDSSRPIASVSGTLAALPVPVTPDAVVGALGTEIALGGELRPDWQERFVGWDRTPVDEVMAALGWRPHPPELQTRYKASFAVPAAGRLEAERRIVDTGVEARYLSGDSDDFDVIPPNAGKEAPLGYLAERLGIDPAHTLAVGDGANDRGLLLAAARSIAVGNASPALRRALAGSDAYMAQAPHASGIIEGLRAHGIIPGVQS